MLFIHWKTEFYNLLTRQVTCWFKPVPIMLITLTAGSNKLICINDASFSDVNLQIVEGNGGNMKSIGHLIYKSRFYCALDAIMTTTSSALCIRGTLPNFRNSMLLNAFSMRHMLTFFLARIGGRNER